MYALMIYFFLFSGKWAFQNIILSIIKGKQINVVFLILATSSDDNTVRTVENNKTEVISSCCKNAGNEKVILKLPKT